MRFQYRLGLSELLELNRSSRYQRVKGGLVTALGGTVILFASWMAFFQEVDRDPRDPILLAFSGGVLMTMGLGVPWLAGFGTWVLGRAPLMSVEVNQEGIHWGHAQGQVWIPWDQFTRWYTTPQLLVLELGWMDAMALPKRCCEPAIWTELLNWATAGIQGN